MNTFKKAHGLAGGFDVATVRSSTKAKPRITTNIMKVMVSKRGIGTTAKHAGNSVVAMAIVLVNQLPLSALVFSSHDDAADNVELNGVNHFADLAWTGSN